MRQVKIDKPILRIPMLAIHLQRELYDQGFKPNKQTHCVPVLTTALKVCCVDKRINIGVLILLWVTRVCRYSSCDVM